MIKNNTLYYTRSKRIVKTSFQEYNPYFKKTEGLGECSDAWVFKIKCVDINTGFTHYVCDDGRNTYDGGEPKDLVAEIVIDKNWLLISKDSSIPEDKIKIIKFL